MITKDLLSFLDESTCCFTAVRNVVGRLEAAGFRRLDMSRKWPVIHEGAKYYVVKNDSAVFAFIAGNDITAGFKIISAHSDSPCFRVKPQPEMAGGGGCLRLNTEVYGGPILYTWFDRPLSLAGRVVLRSDDPLHPVTRIVDLQAVSYTHLRAHETGT